MPRETQGLTVRSQVVLEGLVSWTSPAAPKVPHSVSVSGVCPYGTKLATAHGCTSHPSGQGGADITSRAAAARIVIRPVSELPHQGNAEVEEVEAVDGACAHASLLPGIGPMATCSHQNDGWQCWTEPRQEESVAILTDAYGHACPRMNRPVLFMLPAVTCTPTPRTRSGQDSQGSTCPP